MGRPWDGLSCTSREVQVLTHRLLADSLCTGTGGVAVREGLDPLTASPGAGARLCKHLEGLQVLKFCPTLGCLCGLHTHTHITNVHKLHYFKVEREDPILGLVAKRKNREQWRRLARRRRASKVAPQMALCRLREFQVWIIYSQAYQLHGIGLLCTVSILGVPHTPRAKAAAGSWHTHSSLGPVPSASTGLSRPLPWALWHHLLKQPHSSSPCPAFSFCHPLLDPSFLSQFSKPLGSNVSLVPGHRATDHSIVQLHPCLLESRLHCCASSVN